VHQALKRAGGTRTLRFEATGTGAKLVAATILELSRFLRDRHLYKATRFGNQGAVLLTQGSRQDKADAQRRESAQRR
jgi:hypothetical protein